MRYVMRQKLLSWGDDFYIRDEQGRDVFFVDGKAFSFGDKLSFQDLAGHELAFIKQKVLALGATYEICRNGDLAALVKMALLARCPDPRQRGRRRSSVPSRRRQAALTVRGAAIKRCIAS
jgi:uncharacterized protein YxjI